MKTVMTNSFRGGTGKTTIISNLSAYLASFGMKVVIIDADVVSPSVHALFGLDKTSFDKTLTEYLLGSANPGEVIYDISETIGLPDEILYMIPSSISHISISELVMEKDNFNKIIKLVESIKKSHSPDFIMIDTHPGINEGFLVATGFTDILLNIVRPDNQDYQGAQVSAQISKQIGLKTFFVLNKVHPKMKSVKSRVEKAFKVPVAGVLPFTEDIMLAESQFIFTERYPNHKYSREIQSIGARVFGIKPKEHLELLHYILSDIDAKGGIPASELVCIKRVKPERCKRYISDMLDQSMLQQRRGRIELTVKGQNYLKKYKTISRFVDRFRL